MDTGDHVSTRRLGFQGLPRTAG